MEMREEADFANSTRSVTESLMGPKFSSAYAKGEYLYKPEHIDHFIAAIKSGLQEANRRKGDGGAFDAIALKEVKGKVESGVRQSADGIAWTIGYLILTGDEDVAKTDPMDLRCLLDAALGIAVIDYLKKGQVASRFFAYSKDIPSFRKSNAEHIANHKMMAEYYEGLQRRLREPASITPMTQRR